MATIADRGLTGYQGLVMSQGEFAAALDVSRETVNEWQNAGMPFTARSEIGGSVGIDLAAATTWLICYWLAKAAGGETAKDRLSRVQADRIEIDIAERRGRLVDMEELKAKLGNAIVATRALLLQLPDRVAGAMETLSGYEARRDVLREEIELALRNLADYDPSRDGDRLGLGAVSAASAFDGGRMGGAATLP